MCLHKIRKKSISKNHLTCVRKGRNKYGKGAGWKNGGRKKVCLQQTVFNATLQLLSSWFALVRELYRTTGVEGWQRCRVLVLKEFGGL